jgi:Ca2+-binding RTX toxin-like protein
MTGDETGTITDGTSTGTFSEIEGFELTDQSDTYDGTLSTSDQTILGNAGADTITGGSGNDSISGGDDADIIFINDNFGTDSIAGGEGGTDTDTLDASSLTSGVDVVFTGSEAGTLTDGTDTATFSEIENFFLTGSADTFDGSAGSIGVTVFSGDGTDTVIGGSGADSIDSGTGADIVDGGAGSDTINTGDGADTILLSDNFGSDIITAGEGGTDTDTLDASALTAALDILLTGNETGSATDGTDTATFSQVESFVLTDNDDTFDGSAATTAGATVDGGAGDDSIVGTQADDNLSGGTGQDTIDGGVGADTINAGDDADTILLTDGFGSDVIFGGEGTSTGGSDNDTLDVSGLTASVNVVLTDDEKGTVTDGTDTASFENIESYVLTGLDDTFDGTAGATPVTVDAGAGDDTLIGGTGADTFYGGTGSDTITLNTGDVATGGDGDDAFIIDTLAGGPLDLTITGGEGDETLGDTLDLQGQVNSASDIVYSGGDNESGTITLIDGSVITFSEIETIFICFAYDTHIMTDRGDRPIQSLEIGDRVITRDHGMQKIRWIGSRKVPAKDNMAPILFKQGVFKNTRDLVVSPQHRMLFQGEQAELMFGQSEVLVPAKQLLGNDGVYQVIDGFVEYFHVLFDNHEIIYAEGSATESYHPGDYSLGEIGEASREEIFNIFPELRSTPNAYGPAARTCLKPHEGRLLKI